MVPIVAIGGFAGLRSKELERLDWAEVQLARGFVELKRSKTKTGQRRLVPILPNLARWLTPYAQESGRVWMYSNSQLSHAKGQLAQKAGVKWKHNALRHSFASYRLAQTQNANQVALETGHSVKVLFTNYRELVTPDDAKRWFEIAPNNGG
jgi:integrase